MSLWKTRVTILNRLLKGPNKTNLVGANSSLKLLHLFRNFSNHNNGNIKSDEKEIVGSIPLRKGTTASKRANIRRRIDAAQNATPFVETVKVNTVVAVCTAQAYDIPRLESYLQSMYASSVRIQEYVINVRIQASKDTSNGSVEAFFFGDGCFVLWGDPSNVGALIPKLKEGVKAFEISPLSEKCETETLFYKYQVSDRFYAGIEGETIILELQKQEAFDQNMVKSMLAFSNGLADSVKLAVLENSLEEHIEKTKLIPETLARGKKLNLGRAEVLRLTGSLLKFRADLNLHSELTDTPEIYWSEPQLEDLYHRVSRVLDIRQRAHVLNKKLDYANELAEILRSHLSEQHGLKLEWGIIILIAIEAASGILHWVVG